MIHGRLRRIPLALIVLSASLAVLAQTPGAPPASQPPPPPGAPEQHHGPMPKPTNLQILPKDIATPDLIALMRQYEGQLGVECGYCHAADPATHHMNFASDSKPEKAAARIMMTMTAELNSKYINNLPTGADEKVSCGTCHRGHAMPEDFVPPPDAHEKH